MSALGHKQTYVVQKGMPALPSESEHNRNDYSSNKLPTISLGPDVVAYTKSGKSLPVNEPVIRHMQCN
jgi:hypothetical protein